MPLPSDAAVLVGELERELAQAQSALLTRDWAAVEISAANQRRITQELANVVGTLPASGDAEADALRARLQRIYDVRSGHLRAMETFRSQVGSRLVTLSHWKDALRSQRGSGDQRPSLLDATQ